MSEPTIIAIANACSYVNTAHRILFLDRSTGKAYLVSYDKKISMLGKINTPKELFFPTKSNIPDLNNKMKKSIKKIGGKYSTEKYNVPVYIPFHEYWIVYYPFGSIGIISKDHIIDFIIDDNTSYQAGDRSCQISELNNGDVLIVNGGDVSSCILCTINSPKVYSYDIHQRGTCYDSDCELCMEIDKDPSSMKLISGLDGTRLEKYHIDRD